MSVTRLKASTSFTPKQALEHALGRLEEDGIQDVVIAGYWDDDEFFTFSSGITRKDALWIAEALKDWAFNGDG